jgi:uncharacterized phage protein gp47/JayE
MKYENMTYEVILQRMMDRVTSKYPDLDNREGSLLFNALASAAIELAIAYTEIDNVLNESFVNTASREYLLVGCDQIGMDISAFEAHSGMHKAQFDTTVEIGSRWNCGLYNYTVMEYLGLEDALYTYRVECETKGTAPNTSTGDLTPITNEPPDLTYARLVECLIEGENEASDEDIREAYREYVTGSASDGNVNQYKRWCSQYDSIGDYKIIPLWNGPNTIKVSILSSSNKPASEELIAEFQEYLDPNSEGMGNGVAPIGSIVTVSTATELPINVSADITMKSGYSDTTAIDEAITNYLADIAYKKSVVAYMSVGAMILNTEGVESITNLKINSKTEDIKLSDEQIPIFGTGTWTVK